MIAPEDFKTIKNGIDARIEIICHQEIFYNITKTAKLVAEILKNEQSEQSNEAGKYSPASAKFDRPAKWFQNESAQALIEECKSMTNLDIVYYELKKGTPVQFAGTYVHELLYDHFLTWLDSRYGMKISIILKKIRSDANRVLTNENSDLKDQLNIVIDQNNQLLAHTKHLVGVTEDNQVEISKLHTKIDALFEFMLSFARMIIPTHIGSSVIQQQYDNLAKHKDSGYALKHLKVLFMVGFFVPIKKISTVSKAIGEQTISFSGRGQMKIYACCTNFADIGSRLRILYKKHTNTEEVMFMLKPTAISLISCEINTERILLEHSKIFPDKALVEWNSPHKCYSLTIGAKLYASAHITFDNICKRASKERFQGYQMRLDEYNNSSEVKVDDKILKYINKIDKKFYSSARPFCQQFINSYVVQSLDEEDNDKLIEWAYNTPNRKGVKRTDLGDVSLSTCGYTLRKIEMILEEHSNTDHIKHMVSTGIISKEDLPALRSFAKYTDIDISDIEIPSDLDE